MRKAVLFLLIIFSFSCSKEERLKNNLKQVLISYQEKFPIPDTTKDNGKRKYVYIASFTTQKNDTILFITRSSSGIIENINGYGIYEDEFLKPSFIVDEKKLGDIFILEKINNNLSRYYWKDESFPERYPPIYKYKIEGKKLSFVTVDTIWKTWD